MRQLLRILSAVVITGVIVFGLMDHYSISDDQLYFTVWYAGFVTIALILATTRIYLPIRTLESFVPISRVDTVVVLLVLLQMIYCIYGKSGVFVAVPVTLLEFLPSMGIYVFVFVTLPGYLHGKKWAWALIFLFSVHVLHEAVILEHEGRFDIAPPIPKWVAPLDLIASVLCLRILASTTGTHHIKWKEFAEVLGAIAVSSCVIILKAMGIFRHTGVISDYGFISGASQWEMAINLSGFSAWRHLLLLWFSYAVIAVIPWMWARRRKTERVVQV